MYITVYTFSVFSDYSDKRVTRWVVLKKCRFYSVFLSSMPPLPNGNRNVLPLRGSKHMSTTVILFLKRTFSTVVSDQPSADRNIGINRRVQTRFQTVTSELKTSRIRFALVKFHVCGHVPVGPAESVPWMDDLIVSRSCSSSRTNRHRCRHVSKVWYETTSEFQNINVLFGAFKVGRIKNRQNHI